MVSTTNIFFRKCAYFTIFAIQFSAAWAAEVRLHLMTELKVNCTIKCCYAKAETMGKIHNLTQQTQDILCATPQLIPEPNLAKF